MTSEETMKAFGERLGASLRGGETIDLVGDIGSGKTTLSKGIAAGLGVSEPVQSPTFTISRLYEAHDGIVLAHYDFYRLSEPGIMSMELAESVSDERRVTVLEWSEIVEDILPDDHLTIKITPTSETERQLDLQSSGPDSRRLLDGIR